jgi:hypothetical protein
VRALVEAGATYYSDEYAVLDRQGRVHPYARRPSVRVRGGKKRHPVPRGRGRRPVPVGLVVDTRYHAKGRWAPVPLSPGQIVFALLANTVPARDRPAEVLAVLARTAQSARGIRSDRGAASRTASTLITLARELVPRTRPSGGVRRRSRRSSARRPVAEARARVGASETQKRVPLRPELSSPRPSASGRPDREPEPRRLQPRPR